MEKFVLTGFPSNTDTDTRKKFYLRLPESKSQTRQYSDVTLKNGDDILQQKLISRAVNKSELRKSYNLPEVKVENKWREVPHILRQILMNHPFPFSQGPVVLPLDCENPYDFGYTKRKEGERRKKEITLRTLFLHSNHQPCGEWIPSDSELSSWENYGEMIPNDPFDGIVEEGSYNYRAYLIYSLLPVGGQEVGYKINDTTNKIQGAASSRDNMGLLYTCKSHTCIIHCPCGICTDKTINCRRECKELICKDCESQCTKHQLKLPRLFKVQSDHFTMISRNIQTFQFAIPHAGIPLNCDSCSKDVLEHQIYHLVLHIRCKFCRQENEKCEIYNWPVLTYEDYDKADQKEKWINDSTCSTCFHVFKNKQNRENHEATVHKEGEKKYTCDNCNRTYSNLNALDYHNKTKHGSGTKYTCNMCGAQFSTDANLLRHTTAIHEEAAKIECEDCGEYFTRKDNLKCHMKNRHYDTNANMTYVKDVNSLLLIKCELCDQVFNRKSNMLRHQERIHSIEEEKNIFSCPHCEIKFSRKDNLNRHMKLKHC